MTIGAGNCPNTGFGSKWDCITWGTDATQITWSFMNAGAGAGSNPALTGGPHPFLTGTNQLGSIETEVGGLSAFQSAVASAFATWSVAANISFVQVADNGADAAGNNFNPASSNPNPVDIRIGAYSFHNSDGTLDTNTGAVGYGPPPGIDDSNGGYSPDALAGTILFNTNIHFEIDPGAEGAALQTGPLGIYLDDIQSLVLHEIGHTLGLAHSGVNAGNSYLPGPVEAVMCGYPYSCDFSFVHRQLTPDDIAGGKLIYGPAPVPLPAAAWLLLSGLVGVGAMARRRLPSQQQFTA